MAAFPKLVLTSAGIALQTKVQGGATLELTNIQMGSGQLNGQPIGPLTALISSNTTVPIQSGQAIGQNTYQVEGFFTNADLSAGFWWREIGIFANDPDNGEILYAYANAGDAGDYIPTVTDQRIEKYIYFSMTLANATTVTVTIPQTDTYVLQSTVGQANGVAGLGENGAVPVAQGGTGATTAQDAVVALGALFAIAAAAAYNSSGTYAIGDYCTNDGNLYKCNTPIESGETWTEAHWTTTTVAAELAELSSQLSKTIMPAGPDGLIDDISVLISNSFYGISPITGAAGLPTWWPDGRNSIIQFCPPGSQYLIDFAANFTNKRVGYRLLYNGEWFEIATATPPQEFDLPLAEGIETTTRCVYWKNQFDEVTVICDCTTSQDATSSVTLAMLPQGFRPTARSIFYASLIVSGQRSGGYSIDAFPSGALIFYKSGDIPSGSRCFGLCKFVAAS